MFGRQLFISIITTNSSKCSVFIQIVSDFQCLLNRVNANNKTAKTCSTAKKKIIWKFFYNCQSYFDIEIMTPFYFTQNFIFGSTAHDISNTFIDSTAKPIRD